MFAALEEVVARQVNGVERKHQYTRGLGIRVSNLPRSLAAQ